MSLEKEKVKIPCPNCKNVIEASYRELISRRIAKCHRCNSTYNFTSRSTSNLSRKIRELERAQENFRNSFEDMISSADIVLKK